MASQVRRASSALPRLGKDNRQIFVAYPYRLYNIDDYRRPFTEVSKAFDVKFVFADERISDLYILEKIQTYIAQSSFGIYDISGWNPNVTLELGLAIGMGRRSYIAFDPSKTALEEVPSDVRGKDRMQYTSFADLQKQLERLIGQELPVPRPTTAQNQLHEFRKEALKLLSEAGTDGLGITSLSKAMGISADLARVVVREMLGGDLEMVGERRGARYIVKKSKPKAKRKVPKRQPSKPVVRKTTRASVRKR